MQEHHIPSYGPIEPDFLDLADLYDQLDCWSRENNNRAAYIAIGDIEGGYLSTGTFGVPSALATIVEASVVEGRRRGHPVAGILATASLDYISIRGLIRIRIARWTRRVFNKLKNLTNGK